jgi:hypothetical protein
MKHHLDGRAPRADRSFARGAAARVVTVAALVGAASAAGCLSDNETLVFVDASVEEPQVTVSKGALGTNLTGSFTLLLELGPRASTPSKVTLQTFEIANADRSKTIVPSLKTKTDTAFPVTVELDSDVRVNFTIDLEGALLPDTAADELCGAGGLRITGSIQDSLESGSTPFTSPVFQPSGCP